MSAETVQSAFPAADHPSSAPFRWAVRLTLAGLIVELLSLFRLHHPLGFMFFMAFGFTLTSAGVLIFVYHMLQLARVARSRPSE